MMMMISGSFGVSVFVISLVYMTCLLCPPRMQVTDCRFGNLFPTKILLFENCITKIVHTFHARIARRGCIASPSLANPRPTLALPHPLGPPAPLSSGCVSARLSKHQALRSLTPRRALSYWLSAVPDSAMSRKNETILYEFANFAKTVILCILTPRGKNFRAVACKKVKNCRTPISGKYVL